MLNTNGIRIAREDGFAERLSEYMPNFEIYLQFDSFEAAALMDLRGADLRGIRMQATRNCSNFFPRIIRRNPAPERCAICYAVFRKW